MNNNSNLPHNWSWVKLGDVGDIVGGGTPSTSIEKYFDGDIAWITPADLTGFKNKCIPKGRRNITEAGLKNSSARLIPKGSVLFSSRAPIGYVVIASNELCTNQGFKSVIPNKKVDSEFVYYFLKSAKQLAEKNASGTTFKEISAKNFANLPFPLPLLLEQKKIVEKIEELFSGLDNGVASLKKAKAQIRLYRQSVLASAFNGKLVKDEKRETKNEFEAYLNGVQGVAKAAEPKVDYTNQLPEGWKWVKLGEVADIINGYAFKSGSFKNEGKFQVVKIGNVRPGNLRLEERQAFVDDIEQSILNRAQLKKNDLVISLTGTRKKRDYGYVAMVTNENKLLLNQRLAIIRLHKEYISKYFLYLLRMDLFLDQFFRNETGNVGQGNVGINGIRDSVIPVPSHSMQTQIVEEIEKRFSEADNLEKAIDESLIKSETLRQSILKQAFEGKLV